MDGERFTPFDWDLPVFLYFCRYRYIWMGCGDHSNNAHYVSKALDPNDLATDCSANHHALFLLLVEEGVPPPCIPLLLFLSNTLSSAHFRYCRQLRESR